MPRRAKGPRLHWRADRNTWEVRDGSQRLSLATDCRREAEKALAEYIRQKHRRDGQAPLADFTVGECLSIYATDRAPSIAAPERVAYALNALVPYWGDLALTEITEARCKEYGRIRYKRDGSPVSGGTIRRELNTLQAAINHCHRNNHISGAPRVVLPPHAAPKERWLTVEEAAWLLRAARSLRADGRHLADFILCALYTGSRKATILTLQLNVRNNIGGTADTRTGILYRKPLSKVSTNKRQNNARIPDKYLAHLRRQVANGRRYVVEDNKGQMVGDIRKGFQHAKEIAERLAAEKGVKIDLSDVTPHTLKHTAITWALQRGARVWDVAGMFSTSVGTIERVYGHHSPSHQESAVSAMDRRK